MRARQVEPQETEPDAPALEFGGLLIDETQSKIGRDFYEVFYSNWTAPEEPKDFVITISEQPMPSLGTIISVKVDDDVVYRNRLQPRHDYIRQVAGEAIAMSYRWLHQRGGNNQLWGY